jgi:DNA-binding CsgD family transcriptional regulator
LLDTLPLQRLAAALALDAGDLELARAWLEAHDRWLSWSGAVLGHAEGYLGWAAYHRAAGKPALARRHAEQALACAEQPRQPLALLAAHRLMGELDIQARRYDEATAHLGAALALAGACDAPFERALTLLALADLRRANGRLDDARSFIDEACAICGSLGAVRALALADALAGRISGRTLAGAPAGLTPREIEVLRLVAEGLTDAQVAERLFLSPRTVSQHLRSIYNKLGVSSRAAATRFAIEHGLL